MLVTVTTLSSWTNLNRDTIKRRIPSLLTGQHGEKVDSTKALPMIYGNAERLDPAQERAKLDSVRREIAELDRQQREKELIPLADCYAVIDIAATSCREHLQTIPGRYASIFAAQEDARQIEQDLDSEIRTALEHIANASARFLE